jgi:hypothetical protein
MKKTDPMTDVIWRRIKEHALDLKSAHATREANFQEYNEMYFMDWVKGENEKYKNSQVVVNPDARNEVDGAVRLMVATEPQWTVEGSGGDRLEKFIESQWNFSGMRFGEPLQHALIRPAILYDEMHATITPLREMLEFLQKKKPTDRIEKLYHDATLRQWEEAAGSNAFLIEALNPCGGYPEWGKLDLTAYHREEEVTVSDILARFGSLPEKLRDESRTTRHTLKTFFDAVFSAYWVDDEPLFLDEHGYGFVPVMAQIVNGSRLFAKPEDQRQPLLYTLRKSGMWNAQNTIMTVWFTTVLAMGSVPKFMYVPGQPDHEMELDWDNEIIRLQPGDQFAPVANKGLIDPALAETFALAERKGQESTIYPQALGAPAEKNTTYSEFSLMSQAGRLPLVGPQRRGGWGMARIAQMMLRMAKNTPRYLSGSALSAGDIPDNVHVEAKLEVKLPQERLQMANVGNMLLQQGFPQAWVMENIYGINQPSDLRKQKWNETAAEALYGQRMQQLVMREQQKMQPPQPQGMPPQGQGPMGAGPMMSPGQAEQIQGMPPQMGGMLAGMGQGEVPEGMNGGMQG